MKIISISARNYRVHQDVAISLDPSRNVIGGPNESGKSTLMEAAHRALFMRYKTGGDVQTEMISDGGGQPNVTVDFEVDGKRYQIAKRFSGQTGTAVLTQEGAATLKNEEAESRLAELPMGASLGVAGLRVHRSDREREQPGQQSARAVPALGSRRCATVTARREGGSEVRGDARGLLYQAGVGQEALDIGDCDRSA
jgi:predicted ATPase